MKAKLKRSWELIGHGQGIWGLLPAPIAGFATASLGYLGGYSAFALISAFVIATALIEFVLWRADSKGQRLIYLTALAVLLLFGIGWATVQQNEKRKTFSLNYLGVTVLRSGRTTESGQGRVTGVNVRIDIGNKNDFPIWYKVQRQYAKFGKVASSLDNPGATVTKMLPGHAIYLANNLLREHFENGEYHDGQTEFIVDYGREPNRLDRRFTYSANVQFFLCPVNGNLCGDVTTTNERVSNERIQELE